MIAFSDLNKENIAMDKIRAMLKSAWSWMISAAFMGPRRERDYALAGVACSLVFLTKAFAFSCVSSSSGSIV